MNPLGWPSHRPDTEVEKAFQTAKLALLKTLPVDMDHDRIPWAEMYGSDVHRKELKQEAQAVCRKFGHILSAPKKVKFWFEDVTQQEREARITRLLQDR